MYYTIVLSNFKLGESLGGILEVESNHPVILKVIQEEHHGLQV